MNEAASPFACHVFVCTNDRKGARKSCADGNSADIRAALKEKAYARGWKGTVRVSSGGCLGLCEKGPNVLLYPQGDWFSGVTMTDVDRIMERLEEIVP